MIICNCGGVNSPHRLGGGMCFREIFKGEVRKVPGKKDYWFVEGCEITGFSLRQQRGFAKHGRKWSRPKGGGSYNSIGA